jgi:hypothetical protein
LIDCGFEKWRAMREGYGTYRCFFWGLGEREGRKGKGVGWDGVRGEYCSPPKFTCEMAKRNRKKRQYDWVNFFSF